MKRTLLSPTAIVFAIAMLLSTSPSALRAQVHGDVNGDGVVSALDAQAILTAVVGLPLPGGFVAGNGDANCDASSAALDAQIVLSYVIQLPTGQYCVGQHFGPGASTIAIAPNDTSVLVGRTIEMIATVKDTAGFHLARPMAWTSSAPGKLKVDSARGDTAWLGASASTAGTVTVTATSDGVSANTQVSVVLSYTGIVIVPQRGDTLRQLNGTRQFSAQNRDSVGVVSGSAAVNWSVADTTIATVTSGGLVTALTTGNTLLRIVSQANGNVKDSVPLAVKLPALASCTGSGGTLHAGQTYTTPQLWAAATNPHYVTGTLTFGAGSNLTIEAGALVCMGSGVELYFDNGANLTARGTAADPIVFKPTNSTDYWYGLQFGNNNSTTPDTSVITNATFVHSSNSIRAYNDAVLVMDSVKVRQFGYEAVELWDRASRMSRSEVDTADAYNNGYWSVRLYGGTLESTTIRSRANGARGVIIEDDSAKVQDVDVYNGTQGLYLYSGQGVRLNNVVIHNISGTTPVLDLSGGTVHPSSSNVRVTGGTGVRFRGQLGNLLTLVPDSAIATRLDATLTDTLIITGGYWRNGTYTMPKVVQWRIEGDPYVDSAATLTIAPGVKLEFDGAALHVGNGGRLIARGTAAQPIRFFARTGNYFSGIQFTDPPSSTPAARDTSYLVNVKIDSTSGIYGYLAYAAVGAYTRHVVVIDSSTIRQAQYGGVSLSAPGSRISRTVIDTTGLSSTSYPAISLGDSTVAESTTVRHANATGLRLSGDGNILQGMQILGGTGAGIDASNGILSRQSTALKDSANAYAFYGRIENLAILAPDSASQAKWRFNTDSSIYVTGGNLVSDTLTAIGRMPWYVTTTTYFDTLSHFAPRPGARIRFTNGALIFRQGATMDAHGTAAKPIWFEPWNGSFYGLAFNNPGSGGGPFDTDPVAQSTLINVRVDSASGESNGFYGYGAISGSDRHRLIIDSATVRMAQYSAVVLGARGSRLSRSTIDTTGTPTSSYAAVALNDSTTLEFTTVRRSGQIGVYAPGNGVRLTNVTIRGSVNEGLRADNGTLVGDSGSVTINQGNAYIGRLTLPNLHVLAPDSLAQIKFGGNLDSVIVITGGTLAGNTTTGDSAIVKAIPQIRWQVENYTYFDTLAVFRPRPGSRITFSSGALTFQRGGRMDAHGTHTDSIRFEPAAFPGHGAFYGLQFSNPGAGGNPFSTAPVANSLLINVRVDSASGQSNGFYGYGAISGSDRHRLIIDSAHVRMSQYSAVVLGARGSRLSRSIIDTTGTPTSSYAAVALNDSTTLEFTTVRRSGQIGVYAPGDGAHLHNVSILGSVNEGLRADDNNNTLQADSGSVTIGQGNAYIGRMTLQNLYAIAPDSLAQVKFSGNLDSVIVITAGDLHGNTTTGDTAVLTAIPQIRWQVESQSYFDTLSVFRPRPAARLTFSSAGLIFRQGGRMDAIGTAAKPIRFEPATFSGHGQFYGLLFSNPGGTATSTYSTLTYVHIDSAQGQSGGFYGYGAIQSADRHVMTIDRAVIRQALYTGVVLSATGSSISRSRIDTTRSASYYGMALSDGTSAANDTVLHSATTSVFANGTGITLTNLLVANSGGNGIDVNVAGASLSSFRIENAAGVGVAVAANNVTLSSCTVTGSASHGVATTSSYTGLSVSLCDLVNNGGNGVNNYNTSTGTYVINASNNWWGDVSGPAGPSGDGVSANVTVNTPCASSCGQPTQPPVGSLPPSRQDARQSAAVKRPD